MSSKNMHFIVSSLLVSSFFKKQLLQTQGIKYFSKIHYRGFVGFFCVVTAVVLLGFFGLF